MRRTLAIVLAVFSFASLLVLVSARPAEKPAPATQPATQPVKEIHIDMDQAIDVKLPDLKDDLQPGTFATTDHREGWAIRIPGNRPIATPAYAQIDGRGMLFVGGGYGSHEFYAFDSSTGQKIWEIKTADDGPTAAVVEDGYVAFNTESCTVIVADARTGKVVWQEWLGDPLMSQPAISKGKLYMAHPAGQGQHANAGAIAQQAANDIPTVNGPNNAPATQPANGAAPRTSHRLLCADLKTGKHLWEQDISGDVISAPVIEKDQVFFTCFNGTSFCLASDTGAVAWTKENSGTSAPVIANGQVVVTAKADRAGKSFEGLRRLDSQKGGDKDVNALAESEAGYLKRGAVGNGGIAPQQAHALDSAVGFADAPAAAGLGGAAANANVSSVAQAWSFQGSKAAYANGQILNAQGNGLNCLYADSGQVRWHGLAEGHDIGANAQIFAPPALGTKNMYLCSTQGHVLSIGQDDGKVGFMYAMKQPMAFQPALCGGNVYAATNNGMLICLKTGDPDADGWTAWGGNAQHNKTEAKKTETKK
jgi:Ca-activated chloride channel family protein